MDGHDLDIHSLDSIAINSKKVLHHTNGECYVDALSCKPEPELLFDAIRRRRRRKKKELQVTELHEQRLDPLLKSNDLSISDIQSSSRDAKGINKSSLFDRKKATKAVAITQHHFHFLKHCCHEDMQALFIKCKKYNITLSFNIDGFHLIGPNKGQNILSSEIKKLLRSIKSDSVHILNTSHVGYLLGLKGQQYLKTVGRCHRCFVTVGDGCCAPTCVSQPNTCFVSVARTKLNFMCEVVVAMGDIDVCETDASLSIHIVTSSEATSISIDFLIHGMCFLNVITMFDICICTSFSGILCLAVYVCSRTSYLGSTHLSLVFHIVVYVLIIQMF